MRRPSFSSFFFFNDTATTEIYTLSLHDALPIPTGQRDDLVVIQSANPCDAGGVFTTNKIKSASVVIDELHLQHNRVQALVVISGNANACTRAQGFKDALQMAKLTADRLDLDPDQVLVGTTG